MSWTDQPTLVGNHVTLRPMRPEDRDAVLAASSDGALWRLFYTAVPGPETIDAYMAKAAEEQAARRSMPFVVVASGEVVGATRYMRMNPRHRRLEIGTTFYARRVQRSAVNTETKRLLLGHAFEAMGCNVVQFRTDWLNRASRRAIERLGARQDGVLRAHMVMADGRSRDTVVYSILAYEWPGVRAGLDLALGR